MIPVVPVPVHIGCKCFSYSSFNQLLSQYQKYQIVVQYLIAYLFSLCTDKKCLANSTDFQRYELIEWA